MPGGVTRAWCDPINPDRRALERAVAVIASGGIVAIPTDTLYGLAADPFNTDAVARLFALKARSGERALPLIASGLEQVEQKLGGLNREALMLASAFWPGPLTLLLPAVPGLASQVTGGTGRVGVRVPAHAVARQLCEMCRTPLTATSANISGAPAQNDPDAVAASIGDLVDFLLDSGKTPGGLPSTIVDITERPPTLIRQGAVSWDEVQACLGRR